MENQNQNQRQRYLITVTTWVDAVSQEKADYEAKCLGEFWHEQGFEIVDCKAVAAIPASPAGHKTVTHVEI